MSLEKTPPAVSRVGTRQAPAGPAPKKISIARLPVTGSDIFGREDDIAFLDRAWANEDINVVTFYVIDSGWAKKECRLAPTQFHPKPQEPSATILGSSKFYEHCAVFRILQLHFAKPIGTLHGVKRF